MLLDHAPFPCHWGRGMIQYRIIGSNIPRGRGCGMGCGPIADTGEWRPIGEEVCGCGSRIMAGGHALVCYLSGHSKLMC